MRDFPNCERVLPSILFRLRCGDVCRMLGRPRRNDVGLHLIQRVSVPGLLKSGLPHVAAGRDEPAVCRGKTRAHHCRHEPARANANRFHGYLQQGQRR